MKRKALSGGCLLLLLVLLTLGCATALKVERPKESYLPTPMAPSVSELPLRVELDVKQMESILNKKITGLIYNGADLANQDLQVKVWKAQDFTFTVRNNVIEYRVPLKVWSRFAWKVSQFGVSLGDSYEAGGALTLGFRTSVLLGKNWKLVVKTESTGYQWTQTPQANVAGITLPLQKIADIVLAQSGKRIESLIDKSLGEMVDLKSLVSPVWNEFQNPILISPENQLWLKVTPKEIYMSPLATKGNKLNVTMALYAQIESVVGSQPAATPRTSLPEFRYMNRTPQQFSLNLVTDVTFDKISQLAQQQLVNKTFEQMGKTITIVDLHIFGSEGKAVVEATVVGALKGKIYFQGDLRYNREKNMVEVVNPEFDLNTKNVLAKTANWMLHGFLLKQITPYLSYNIKADLEQAKEEANKMIGSYKVVDGIELQGKLSTIDVTDLQLVPGAVRARFTTKGNIGVSIADFNF